jgi:uncharacterized protein YjbI with pentapeptide repeats
MGKSKPGDLKGRWTKTPVREAAALFAGRPLGLDLSSTLVGTVEVDGRAYLDLRGFPFQEPFLEVALDRVDLSGCVFGGSAGFARVTAADCRLVGARLEGAVSGTFTGCRFDGCTFDRPLGIPGTRFIRCSFDGARFRGGDLNGSTFEDCSLRDCKMSRTEFRDCQFAGCDFTGVDLRQGSLAGAVFSRAKNNFRYADPANFAVKHEFVADPAFPTIDLGETIVLNTIFRAD